MTKKKVVIGEKTIEIELQRKNVKNINLRIRPDLTVVVSANPRVPYAYIERFVRGKSDWIIKNIDRFDNLHMAEEKMEFVSGENVRYLGREYTLIVKETPQERVKLYRDYLYVNVREQEDYQRKERLFNRWIREKAEQEFKNSLERIYPQVQKHGIRRPSIKIRKMKTRWGSCSRHKQSITLNLELVKAPRSCIDYVLLHELIHFKYRYHDKHFYHFLSYLMPDWRERKAILDTQIIQ